MKLKKINAILGLLTSFALIVHMGYNCFSYLTFYYNPTLKFATAMPLAVLVCAHAVCGMCAVFFLKDGSRLDLYPGHNKKTILQRLTAMLIFPLLFLHVQTFHLLQSAAAKGFWFGFGLLMFLQVVFFVVITLHMAISFSKGCITLGLIDDEKKLKLVDRCVWCLSVAMLLVTSFAVIRGQIIMFCS